MLLRGKRCAGNLKKHLKKVLLFVSFKSFSIFNVKPDIQFIQLPVINCTRRIQHHIPSAVVFRKGNKVPDAFAAA
jgi:hypothetical protein